MRKMIAGALAAACVFTSVVIPRNESTALAAFVIEADAQTAMEKNQEAVLAAIEKAEFTNDITRDELESIIMGACDYSSNEYVGAGVETVNYKMTPSTALKSGSVKADVILSQNDGEVAFSIEKEIPRQGGGAAENVTADTAKKEVLKGFDRLAVSNATTAEDIANAAEEAAPDGVNIEISDFYISEATQSSYGSISAKCTLTLADDAETSFVYKWEIAKVSGNPKQELEAASKAISDAMWTFEVSNDTTAKDILAMAENALPDGSNVFAALSDNDFSITKATTTVNGTVSATIVLSCSGVTKRCPVGKTIQPVVTVDSTKIAEDCILAGRAIDALTYSNKITKEEMLNAALSAVKNGSSAVWKDNFYKKDATFQADGEIIGYLQVTCGDETREVRLQEKIPMLVRKIPSDKLSVNKTEWDILRIMNVERAKERGIPLRMIAPLQDSCDIREPELVENFSHTRPDGSKCFTAIKDFNAASMGENIYACPSASSSRFVEIDSEKVMTAWMNSTGHRANILSTKYNYVGVGAYDNKGTGTAVQMFAGLASIITSVQTSAGTMDFEDEEEMQKEYLIFTDSNGLVSYMPIDVDYMTKTDKGYTLDLPSEEPIVLTVGNSNSAVKRPSQSASLSFADVAADAYYADAVKWAVERRITTGTSDTEFSPADTCTRAQILTFLWRAVGAPESDEENPFSDVKESDYYYDAAVWAYEKGIVNGNQFGADTPCTRSSTVTYLWKNAGSPQWPEGRAFADVDSSSEYAKAVAWAVGNGVTSGMSDTEFSPEVICDRGQIVTFLKRALN